jgi:triacylglycerol esterase/lipase EstA (alpha/beta hydrolase family)
MRRRIGIVCLLTIVTVGLVSTTEAPAGTTAGVSAPRPVVFVHGGAGSGAQFESQAMRFASNGYPTDWVRVLDYNSTDPSSFGTIPGRLDALIAALQADTGAAEVDLLGHSLGTGIVQAYLSSPARAANVAHYVNIDGATAAAPPGGVETLALWGAGSGARRIPGAKNV